MIKFLRLACLLLALVFQSCIVTESMIVNEDTSGEFEVTYDLSNMSEFIGNIMPPSDSGNDDMDYDEYDENEVEEETNESEFKNDDFDESEEAGEVVDTLIVFDDLFVQYQDSIAALPEKEQKALENLRGMYVRMNINEPEKLFKMGIGMPFESFDDLKDIQKRVKEARDMNSKDSGVDQMTENSPFSGLMGNEDDDVRYEWSAHSFSRTTVVMRETDSIANAIKEMEQSDSEFNESFKESSYIISYSFPKRIKSTSVEGAVISEDRKSITYKASWFNFIADPRLLDIMIEFENE